MQAPLMHWFPQLASSAYQAAGSCFLSSKNSRADPCVMCTVFRSILIRDPNVQLRSYSISHEMLFSKDSIESASSSTARAVFNSDVESGLNAYRTQQRVFLAHSRRWVGIRISIFSYALLRDLGRDLRVSRIFWGVDGTISWSSSNRRRTRRNMPSARSMRRDVIF